MAEAPIAPIVPNMGGQEAAIAGSAAVIFTASDRKIIEERGGTIDKQRSFLDALRNNPLTPEVENEQTTIHPQRNVKELQAQYREHKHILKHSAIFNPQEHVEISNKPPDTYEEQTPPVLEIVPPAHNKELAEQTATVAKELQLNPAEVFDKFSLEQDKLLSLVLHIKELHLARLLTESKEEFESLSNKIETATLASVKDEAQDYFKEELNKLTRTAVEYKLGILNSLQAMEVDLKRKAAIKWLQKVIERP